MMRRGENRAVLAVLLGLTFACQGGGGDGLPATMTVHQAITGGEVDEFHPAVGKVVSPGSMCTGTIIAPQIVLTAAHCVNPEQPPVQFHLGHLNGVPEAVLEVVEAKVHPAYDPLLGDAQGGKPNDIAVLKLAEPAPVPPIRFRTEPMDCLEGTPVLFVGYGKTNPTDPGSSGSKFKVQVTVGKLTESGFFTYSIPGAPKNACPGDSGGPALLVAGGKAEVVGVMSTADKYCEWQTFLVRPDLHTAWLYGQIQELDPAGLPSQCGDGLCEYLEDDDNCAEDCASGGGGPWTKCEADSDCLPGLICAAFESSDNVCAAWCAGPQQGTGCPCGSHCTPYELTPGDGLGICLPLPGQDANCGDGACDAGESSDSCPADCVQAGCGEIGGSGCCSGNVAVRCEKGLLVLQDCSLTESCGWDHDAQHYACDTNGEPSPEVEMACPDLPPPCGNGLCEPLETQENCPLDCLYDGFCGDGMCNGTEDFAKCPDDCKKDICDVLPEVGCCQGNVAVWCLLGDLHMFSCDHHAACGWNGEEGAYLCDTAGEADPEGFFPMGCENYPAISCGDGKCNGDETFQDCPEDCDAPVEGCGDGDCGAGEDFATCPQDCYQSGCGKIGREGCCDNGLVKWCEYGGTFIVNCSDDPSCGWSDADGYYWCGTDGAPEPTGTYLQTCEEVNNAVCGDGHCDLDENAMTCAQDCAAGPAIECGDGQCEAGEDAQNCPADCVEAGEKAPEAQPEIVAALDVAADVTCVDCDQTEPKPASGGCGATAAASATTLLLWLLLLFGLVGWRRFSSS